MSYSDELGKQLKYYEARSDYSLSETSRWVIRLDGHGFSKFTKRIKAEKPYDEELAFAMRETTKAVMDKFGFVTGYCQSDEITLIPNLIEGRNNLWNLRIQKLCSLIASYASVTFYTYMRDRIERMGLENCVPTFDARVFCVDEIEELKKVILWRQYDCLKNAKNLVGQKFFSHKELQGLTSNEQVLKVQEQYGVSFSDYPAAFRYGSLFKRRLVQEDGYDPITKQTVKVLRGRIFEYNEFIPSMEFAVSKYWES